MRRKIVTSYINPDMDGTASMYAYVEFLRKRGEEAGYYFEGIPKKEVRIVSELFNIKLEKTHAIHDNDRFVLVDTNDVVELPKCVIKENVVEIIDHHKKREWLTWNEKVNIQIELIGSAATLIAEKFKNENIEISKEAAILLYYGIISNTMNLKIKMTSKKDIEMAEWLKGKVPEINDKITEEIFIKKSEIGDALREEMEVELKDQFVTISWSMGQLEIANVESFLEKYERDIRNILHTVKIENDVEYISVNCMDILNGYSIVLAYDEKTAKIISEVNNLNFDGLKAKTDELISRKELVQVVREKFKK